MARYLLIMVAMLATCTVKAQESRDSLLPKGSMGAVKATKFRSAINNQEYVILVNLPDSYNDSSRKKYPVIYALDAQWSFPNLVETEHALLYDNLMEEVITVGIAFRENYFTNRNRDFTPTKTGYDPASGGGKLFLDVIKNGIIPYIDSLYRTDKKNRALLGGSSGGLFVLYSLLQQPSPFNRFIATTPSLWYDDQLISRLVKEYAGKSKSLNAKLFLSSGGYEEDTDPAGNFKNFCDQLIAVNFKGLEMESLVVEKTGHLSVGYYTTVRGLPFIFPKPEVRVDSMLLKKYAGKYEQGMNLIQEGDSLFIELGPKKSRFSAISANRFYLKGVNGIAEFKDGGKGKSPGVTFTTADGVLSATRID